MVKKPKLPGTEWVPDTGDFIKISPDLCSGCGDCVVVCFGDCIKIRGGKAIVVAYETCCECGACWFICSENAIEFSWPKGGTGIKIEYG
ncbi:MAG: ferredoxin family protein [Dehalococcoidia bacterium]|jgi:NAD-dependent dihydropyrimidine dehydrogenase PreA subunit|nr:ferredoxin family protein [Chloroflexota bacterium]MCK4242768.1 ferredoxin family protein [Dehalococcoidia bacterium]